jgi:hypothetical protein
MAILAYTNVRTLAGGYELTCISNEARIDISRAVLDATTMCSGGWEEKAAGLKSAKAMLTGFADFGASSGLQDAAQFTAVGGAAQDIMILPTGGADAEPAFFGSAMRASYNFGNKVGDMAAFSAEWEGTGVAARGQSLKTGTLTATGTGTIMQLGAVTSGQTAYFQIQVPTVSGTTPSLTMIVQSAALVGFGSPTTRASFTALTAAGSQTIAVAGPITDQFWRVSYTISGTTPSFTVYVVGGIQTN